MRPTRSLMIVKSLKHMDQYFVLLDQLLYVLQIIIRLPTVLPVLSHFPPFFDYSYFVSPLGDRCLSFHTKWEWEKFFKSFLYFFIFHQNFTHSFIFYKLQFANWFQACIGVLNKITLTQCRYLYYYNTNATQSFGYLVHVNEQNKNLF